MAENAEFEKLDESIGKFLEVYKILSSEAKAAFESKLPSAIKGDDEKTQNLYRALLKAAKEGKDTRGAFEAMDKTRKEGLDGCNKL